jgi:hypothetical protein
MAQKPRNNDPFPTAKLSVPFLAELLDRLREPKTDKLIIIFQAQNAEEGEWILANVASRLARSGLSVHEAEPSTLMSNLELSLSKKVAVALVGEMRRVDDGKAVRTAASLGLSRIVAFFAMPDRTEFDNSVKAIGPWDMVDLVTLTRQPPPRPAGSRFG